MPFSLLGGLFFTCAPARPPPLDLTLEADTQAVVVSFLCSNLALFLGACFSDDGSLCLISEHMSGGSLEDFFESKSHAHARQGSGNGFDVDLRELVLSWTQDGEQIRRIEG